VQKSIFRLIVEQQQHITTPIPRLRFCQLGPALDRTALYSTGTNQGVVAACHVMVKNEKSENDSEPKDFGLLLYLLLYGTVQS
jgi:hypothetical protein